LKKAPKLIGSKSNPITRPLKRLVVRITEIPRIIVRNQTRSKRRNRKTKRNRKIARLKTRKN